MTPSQIRWGVTLASFLMGFLAVTLVGKKTPGPFLGRAIQDAKGPIFPLVRARSLVLGDESLVLGFSPSGEPGMWLKGGSGGTMQMGVHDTGFPYLLVSDAAERNFALGRVDGAMASPIFVVRHEDQVKLVFGLDMTHPAREPFLAYWAQSGKKQLLMGDYCEDSSRVCNH